MGETEHGQPFVAMEYLPGQTLDAVARKLMLRFLERGGGVVTLGPMLQTCEVLTEYRSGNYAKAAAAAAKDISTNAWMPEFDLVARLGLAMSQHRLGHTEEARRSLAGARELVARWDKEFIGSPEKPGANGWAVWLLAKPLLAEAEALIEEQPAAGRHQTPQ